VIPGTDKWIGQEKDEVLKFELEVIFGRRERPQEEEDQIIGREEDAAAYISKDRFESSKDLGLTTMDPTHQTPSEKERLSMKVFTASLLYAEHADRGDLALVALKQSLSLNPHLSEAWYKMGCYYMMHQSTEKAVEALQQCVKLSPLFVQAYSDLAAALMVLKNYDRALSILIRAAEINPTNLPVLYNKAICHQTRGDWKDAITTYEKILHIINVERSSLEKDPDVIDTSARVNERSVVFYLANCYTTAESMTPVLDNKPKNFYYEKSRLVLEAFLDREPKDDKAFCLLGHVYSELQMAEGAAEAFQNAVNNNPENIDAQANLGMMLYSLGKFQKSLVHIEHALELDASLYQLHMHAAHVHRTMGNFEQAIRHYQKALEGSPAGASEAHVYLAVLLFNGSQFERAKHHLDEAIKYFPQSIEVHYYLAKYHKMTKQAVPARSHFEMAYRLTIASMPSGLKQCFEYLEQGNHEAFSKAIHLELTDASLVQTQTSYLAMPDLDTTDTTVGTLAQYLSNNSASLLKEMGRLADAIRVYQAVLAAFPKFIPAIMNLAETYEVAGLGDKAIEQYATAVEIDPKMTDAQVHLGSSYAARGDFEKALPLLQAAVQSNRNNISAWHTLADCQVELGQYRSAQQSYNMVIRMDPGESDAHVGIGVSYYHLKRFKDAEMSYQQAIEVSNGQNHLAYYNLSSALFAQMRPTEAMQALHKTIEIEPDFAHAHLDIALTLLEENSNLTQGAGTGGGKQLSPEQMETVVKHLNKAMELDPSLRERVPTKYHRLIKSAHR
jgi:tetratricopeptide (TPR) repeat protein